MGLTPRAVLSTRGRTLGRRAQKEDAWGQARSGPLSGAAHCQPAAQYQCLRNVYFVYYGRLNSAKKPSISSCGRARRGGRVVILFIVHALTQKKN